MPSTSVKKTPKRVRIGRRLSDIGAILIACGLILGLYIYAPLIREEIRYAFGEKDARARVEARPEDDIIAPLSTKFGIVIPKIAANSRVVQDVDPWQPRVYQNALTQGVAHANGTALPGERGNVFLFAHSSVDFYQAARYNAVFYLLPKLSTGDDIYVFYEGDKYRYKVTETKKVAATDVQYLRGSNEQTLTLMTCWPPGTTLQRYLVVARLIANN